MSLARAESLLLTMADLRGVDPSLLARSTTAPACGGDASVAEAGAREELGEMKVWGVREWGRN